MTLKNPNVKQKNAELAFYSKIEGFYPSLTHKLQVETYQMIPFLKTAFQATSFYDTFEAWNVNGDVSKHAKFDTFGVFKHK